MLPPQTQVRVILSRRRTGSPASLLAGVRRIAAFRLSNHRCLRSNPHQRPTNNEQRTTPSRSRPQPTPPPPVHLHLFPAPLTSPHSRREDIVTRLLLRS